jgi:hypothetical protein
VAYPNVACQPVHMAGMKYVANQPVVLAQKKALILKGNNARCILASVLKYGQRIIERLINVRSTDDADNATHG